MIECQDICQKEWQIECHMSAKKIYKPNIKPNDTPEAMSE
jgi:hypothetical protein